MGESENVASARAGKPSSLVDKEILDEHRPQTGLTNVRSRWTIRDNGGEKICSDEMLGYNSDMKWARTIWAVVWMLTLVVALIFQTYAASRQPYFRITDCIGLVTLVLLIYKHSVAHSERFNIAVEKLKLLILNTTTDWSLEVRLDLVDDEEAEVISTNLENVLAASHKENLRVDRRTPTEFNFRLNRHIMAVAGVERDDTPSIHIRILDMSVSYRESIDRIEKHLCPLFQEIEHHFHARPDGHKYGLIAHFRGGNPFFGIFIQKLKVSSVAAFSLTIKTDKKDSVLSVKRDSVELVARSLDNFRTEFVNTFRLGIGAS